MERFNPVDDRFEECGGKILESSDNGEPVKWICGVTSEGISVHPPEANIEEDSNLYSGIAKHPQTGKSCWVVSRDKPEDLDIWP